MILLVKQELFKLTKKKSTFIAPLLLVLLIIVAGILTKKYSDVIAPDIMFTSNFSGTSWIVFIMIAASSAIISMESQYGTLKNLLYRKYYRGEILVSKYLFPISICISNSYFYDSKNSFVSFYPFYTNIRKRTNFIKTFNVKYTGKLYWLMADS